MEITDDTLQELKDLRDELLSQSWDDKSDEVKQALAELLNQISIAELLIAQ